MSEGRREVGRAGRGGGRDGEAERVGWQSVEHNMAMFHPFFCQHVYFFLTLSGRIIMMKSKLLPAPLPPLPSFLPALSIPSSSHSSSSTSLLFTG